MISGEILKMFSKLEKSFCQYWKVRRILCREAADLLHKRFQSSRTGKVYEIVAIKEYVGFGTNIRIHLKDLNKKWFSISSVDIRDFLGQARLGEFTKLEDPQNA